MWPFGKSGKNTQDYAIMLQMDMYLADLLHNILSRTNTSPEALKELFKDMEGIDVDDAHDVLKRFEEAMQEASAAIEEDWENEFK